ncbi:MAG: vanadium-dependent haloperoxidase [Candidatus Binatia bacterium]
MSTTTRHHWTTPLVVSAALLASPMAQADVVTDWNITATDIVIAGGQPPPPNYRMMTMVQSAVYEAVNAITKRYPGDRLKLDAAPGASVEAAVAAANRAMLLKLVPAQQATIDTAYHAALAKIADGPAKTGGIAVGEQAAAAILTLRADDGAALPESYRPDTTPGLYVPTVIPIVSEWPQRKPWVMARADQFRPGPPPSLTSDLWARDYNEIKALGAKNSTTRSAEQTAIARFWETARPSIYFQVVGSVANAPGREVTQNTHLFAAVTQAMDDALIAIFDAKYHYHFWRPVTAIRNGDTDGNAATERDASWLPFIDTPMHPEYPCAHCILSATVGTLLQAEIGTGPMPTLTTTSDTAQGAARSWTKIDDFMQEVAEARICDGVHYRTSTEVGTDMGKKLGQLVAAKYFQPAK